jgi:predicted transcriptional regulator
MAVQPFQTMDEVDNYLSGNKIQCLLCGKDYRSLTAQHIELHGLSHDEYRVKFGIPYGRSLTSAATRDRCRARVTPEGVEMLLRVQAQYVDSRRGLPLIATPPRPVARAVTDLWGKQGRKSLLKSQTPVTTKCSICGCDFVTTLSVSKRRVRCMNCAPTWIKTTRDNYWRKKLGPAYVPMHEKKMPEREPFQTREQVDEYLSGESLQCLICGRRFNGLHMHLKFKHGITDDEYRQRFGIPRSRSLTSVTYRAKATAGQAATVACANCGDEVATSKYHASKRLLCLKCDVSSKGKARASYWPKKMKIVPPPLSAAKLAAFETPFHTPEAVDAYLAGETVACLICGQHMSSLPLHLHRTHHIAADDYRRLRRQLRHP